MTAAPVPCVLTWTVVLLTWNGFLPSLIAGLLPLAVVTWMSLIGDTSLAATVYGGSDVELDALADVEADLVAAFDVLPLPLEVLLPHPARKSTGRVPAASRRNGIRRTSKNLLESWEMNERAPP